MHSVQAGKADEEDRGGEMTYYERLKNAYDRNVYCSPDERTERFMQLLEADKERRLKEERRAEIRKDQEVMKYE